MISLIFEGHIINYELLGYSWLDSSVAEFLLWVHDLIVRGPGFKSQFSPFFLVFKYKSVSLIWS